MYKKLVWTIASALLIVALLVAGACTQPAPTPTTIQPPTTTTTTAPKTTAPPTTTTVSKPKVKLIYHTYNPPNDFITVVVKQWVDLVQKAGVDLEVEYFFSGSLVKASDHLKALGQGVYDFTTGTPAYAPAELPMGNLVNSLPLLTPSPAVASAMATEFYTTYAPGVEEQKKMNIMTIFSIAMHDYNLLGKIPVKSLQDVKGYRARTWGLLTSAWDLLGGASVSMPIPDCYTAIDRGTVDGILAGYASLDDYKIQEVAKYHTTMNFGAFPAIIMFNLQKFNSLPPDVQKTMKNAAQEMARINGQMYGEAETKIVDNFKKAGVTFNKLSDADLAYLQQQIAPKVNASAAKTINDKGLPGDAAVKLLQDLVKKYSAIYK